MTTSSSTQKIPAKSSNFPSTEPALYFVEDVFGRAMVPFVLLGDTAKAIVDNLDQEVNVPIEIGVRKQHYTEYARSTLRMFLPPDTVYGEKQITFEHQGTPVNVKIIHRNYKILEQPDTVFYRITHFKIPNPFSKYLKMRNVIQ